MITLLDAARLSSHVYNINQPIPGLIVTPIKGGELLHDDWGIVTDIDSHFSPSNEFYCALYIKFSEGRAMEAVVAVRGTVFSKLQNDWEDLHSWFGDVVGQNFLDHIPGYYALDLTEEIKRLGRSVIETDHLSETQSAFLKCKKEDDLLSFLSFSYQLKVATCQIKSFFKEYGHIIKAQHSIDNLISALISKQNNHFGFNSMYSLVPGF